MRNGKRVLMVSAVVLVVGIAASVAGAFYGLPWKEKAAAAKLENYLEEKYEQDFTLKETFYNFKNGSYGGVFYPSGEPELAFYAEEGFAEYPYVDIYPEVLWASQLKETIEPVAKELFPENASVDTGYTTYESLDIVKGPDIPRFDQTEAMLTVQIKVKEGFPDSDQEWEKMAALVKEVQHLAPSIDTTFNYIDKKKGNETFLVCPPKRDAEINTVREAKKLCSMDIFDLESEVP